MREREARVRRGKRNEKTDPILEREEEGRNLRREWIAPDLEKGKLGPGLETEIIGPDPGTDWNHLLKTEEADPGHLKSRR